MKKLTLLISFICLIELSQGQTLAAQYDSLFKSLHQEGKFYGNVLIAGNDKIIYQQSFGKANYATGEELKAGSVFELASVSKQFTAMGIMLLKEQGKLQYEDSLRKFFPQLPYHNITIRHLLHHTSGLPDYMPLFSSNWDSTKIATNADILLLLANQKPPVLFLPGDKWEYSNTGYAILASIIERVSGMEFGKFLDRYIFQTLGMKHTFVFRRRFENRTVPDYAYGYVRDQQTGKYVLPDSVPGVASMVYSLDGIVGDGTVNSTTNDLLIWARGAYKLVNKETMEEAFRPAPLKGGKTFNYGFGWAISATAGGKTISHSGGWPGYNTYIERHIDHGNTIIILRNHETDSPFPLKSIRNILYGIKDSIPVEKPVSAAILEQYKGEYELAPGFSIVITTENGKIYAQATGQEKFEIFSEKEDVFFLKVVVAKMKFTRDAKGAVTGMILYQNAQEVEGIKKQ